MLRFGGELKNKSGVNSGGVKLKLSTPSFATLTKLSALLFGNMKVASMRSELLFTWYAGNLSGLDMDKDLALATSGESYEW